MSLQLLVSSDFVPAVEDAPIGPVKGRFSAIHYGSKNLVHEQQERLCNEFESINPLNDPEFDSVPQVANDTVLANPEVKAMEASVARLSRFAIAQNEAQISSKESSMRKSMFFGLTSLVAAFTTLDMSSVSYLASHSSSMVDFARAADLNIYASSTSFLASLYSINSYFYARKGAQSLKAERPNLNI